MTHSLNRQSWRWRLDTTGQARALALTQQVGVSDILARVLVGRGVAIEDAVRHLDPTVRTLMPDPHLLTDMAPAVDRLLAAVMRRESVAIYGDYDVDGAASAALLGGFLQATATPFRVHIPDRLTEGYGPNVEGVRTLAADGATLLVTVDCGTTSLAPIAEARRLGLDTIVLDHHQAPESLPPALAIVNPNRQDDLSGLRHLCAAGVVFMTLVALNRALRLAGFWSAERPAPDLLEMLDLVALATVADVVPLIGLNRALVTKGLLVMHARGRPGLRALADIAGLDGPPRPFHLGFVLGPRINAGGRIGDAALGARLLLESDDSRAEMIAAQLHALNGERQTIERATLEAAEALAQGDTNADAAVIVAGEGWHPGVVGLVAARLKERFRRPAFAIAFTGEVGTGSGRSILGVDIGRAVRAAVDAGILIKGGGHAMAAGLTVLRTRLADLEAFLRDRLADAVSAAQDDDGLRIDATLTARGATAALVADVERAGPFGSGNPEPVFAFLNHRLGEAAVVGQGHVRASIVAADGARVEAIAFRCADTAFGQRLLQSKGEVVHVAGALTLNRYGGSTRVQFRVADAADPRTPASAP